MKNQLSRRQFLRNTTIALGASSAAAFRILGRDYSEIEQMSRSLNSVDSQHALPDVFFTPDISSNGLLDIYSRLTVNRKLSGKVAVKLHSGEPGGHNYPNPNLIKELVQSINGTIVECNTAYGGRRTTTSSHKQVLADHGFTAIAPTDIMDEEGYISLPFADGKNIKEDFVGSHFSRYNSFLILSHFKGHAMGGFGGALKNMSIGIASSSGKCWIHTAGKSMSSMSGGAQNPFLESMAEAAGAVMKSLEERVVYINLMNHLSVDCDCDGSPAKPELDDIGILASLDPVALDQACVDLVYASDPKKSAALRGRIESRNGLHTLDHAETLGLGSRKYQFIDINSSAGVCTDHQDISRFVLFPAYPNPFNAGTTLSYYLDSASFVELSIYNAGGQWVDSICKENQNAGHHVYKWNPPSASTGMYFIKLSVDNYTCTRRCIYLQ